MELDIKAIEYELGELKKLEQMCLGVWYASVNDGKPFNTEYYFAETDAPCLSDYAKSLGKTVEDLPELLLYNLDEIEGGKFVVKYEVQRYLKQHDLPPLDGDSILDIAMFGTEHHPDYFGDYPSPLHTPRGMTTRRCKLAKGIFAVETEQCETMVAVCAPIWGCDLSPYALKFGEQVTNSESDYKFFPPPADSLVLFELRQVYDELKTSKHINYPALMNAIWNNYPEYAAAHNSREQHGLNDVGGLFFKSLGMDVEPEGSIENMIVMYANADNDFLMF